MVPIAKTAGPVSRRTRRDVRGVMTHRRLRQSSPRGVTWVRVRDRPRRPLSSDPGEGTGEEDAWGWLAASSEPFSECAFPEDSDAAAPESPSPLGSVMCVVEA